jgi:hypothetical protein
MPDAMSKSFRDQKGWPHSICSIYYLRKYADAVLCCCDLYVAVAVLLVTCIFKVVVALFMLVS